MATRTIAKTVDQWLLAIACELASEAAKERDAEKQAVLMERAIACWNDAHGRCRHD